MNMMFKNELSPAKYYNSKTKISISPLATDLVMARPN